VELREFALKIVTGESLESKLFRPREAFTDREPGPELRLERPGRPPSLQIHPSYRARVPSKKGMADPRQRVRILHAFANHELQAVELFAWAILAFPEAPCEFRDGLAVMVGEEQTHVAMYRARLVELGKDFGAYPVSGYFWSKTPRLTTPARFVCAMSLTFENANLDHSAEYAEAARAAGDIKTARLLEKVGEDEVGHVRFGATWLKRWKDPGQSLWEAYSANVTFPLRGALARGRELQRFRRLRAGLDEDFIEHLASADRGDGSRKAAP